MSTWRSCLAVPLAAACIAVVVGCGSSSKSSSSGAASSPSTTSTSTSTPAANPAVVKLVPASIKSKGLTVAADATYPPDEFVGSNGHTVEGMDADLMKAIGGLMGVKVSIANQTFDSIIPGLAAGKFNVGASSFTDTKEREKTVDFVDYFTAGESFFTKASGGATISGLADLCGKTVAVEKGTTEEADATKQGTKCKSEGKPGVTVLSFPDQNGANQALATGRAQLGFADSPVAEYQVKLSSGQFKVVGPSIANAPYGLAVPKNSGLTKPIQAAVLQLMKDGTYKSILTHWGIQAGAIPASQVKINGATS